MKMNYVLPYGNGTDEETTNTTGG